MKISVVGNPEAVLGFSLAGMSGRMATNADEANQALDEVLATPDVGIVLVTEDVAAMIAARMDALKMKSTVPLVVEIPAPGEPPPGKPTLSEIVKRAIGIKI
jgi:V/A-type H+-transporting ATPase subunit F